MRLISCDNCAVILDEDKIEWPEMYDDEGEFINGTGEWDGDVDTYQPVIPCPVCKETIVKGA